MAQRPSTCAVPGMPAAAIDAGAVTETAPPTDLARRLNDWFQLPLG
ncbi:chemotaxis protein CheB [Elstera litoralis]|nr:chemotaxis protein CheB [Elstera litoralis]